MRISDWSSDVCSSDLGMAKVVVDGLGDGDEVDAALLGQTAQDGLAAVAADADKGIELQPPVAFDDLSRAIDPAAIGKGIIKRVTLVGGAEDGAAAEQQGAVEEARLALQDVGVNRALQQPRRAVAETDAVPAVVTGRTPPPRSH